MDHLLPSRRNMLQLTAGGMASAALAGCASIPNKFVSELVTLQASAGGRLGVEILVPAKNARIGLNADQRFGMASTFKLPLAGLMLMESHQGRLSLELEVAYSRANIVANSPVTLANLDKGKMTIGALARATQMTSDNAAANLLLARIGGPVGFTAKLRELGDATTRLDRLEPMMNNVISGELNDTTSPSAMAATVAKMVLTDWLPAALRAQLIEWMVDTQTGTKRIRAGLPPTWKSGDKTGTVGSPNPLVPDRYNDVAVTWPNSGPPMVIAAYYEPTAKSASISDEFQAVLAQVGRIAAAWYVTL